MMLNAHTLMAHTDQWPALRPDGDGYLIKNTCKARTVHVWWI